jgi:hypothetical protein
MFVIYALVISIINRFALQIFEIIKLRKGDTRCFVTLSGDYCY